MLLALSFAEFVSDANLATRVCADVGLLKRLFRRKPMERESSPGVTTSLTLWGCQRGSMWHGEADETTDFELFEDQRLGSGDVWGKDADDHTSDWT